MDNATVAAPVVVLLGILAPPVISFLKSVHAPAWASQLLAVAVCIGAGALSAGLTNGWADLTLASILGFAGVSFTIAQVAYKLFFKDVLDNSALEAALWGAKQPEAPAVSQPSERVIGS